MANGEGILVGGLFSSLVFTGFGPDRLNSTETSPPHFQVRGKRSSTLRAAVRSECPRRPGVYGMIDEGGGLIYVGKAKSLRARLLSYFRPRSRDRKAGFILAPTRTLAWEYLPSEFAALLRELELIRRWRPRYNVQGQPHRRRSTYLCLGRRPAPFLFLASRPPASSLACYGPVPSGEFARTAVRRLNDHFALRDCPKKQPMVFAGEGELFPLPPPAGCLRLEIGTCQGPCAAGCTHSDYLERVQAARDFLEGLDLSLIAQATRDMETASARLNFEKAAALRDQLEILHWLHQHLERLRQARQQHSFIYPVRGYGGEVTWYLIHQGQVKTALSAPRSAPAWAAAAEAIGKCFRDGQSAPASLSPQEVDEVLLVAAWFRKHPEERARVKNPGKALEGARINA